MLSMQQWQAAQKEIAPAWRLLDTGYQNGALNMGIDEAILLAHAAGTVPPTLRFYGWQPRAVSLGYFQHAHQEIDFDACAAQGIDIVRRLTGGRAVLHSAELTYSIVLSEAYPGLPPSITASYQYLSQGLLAGIHKLGLDARLTMPAAAYSLRRHTPASAACFDSPSHYELTVQGRKLIGSAQVRKQGLILQHGSILLDFDPAELTGIFNLQADAKLRMQDLLRRRVISLKEALGRLPAYAEVRNALITGITTALQLELQPGTLTTAELQQAQLLAREKYGQAAWLTKR